MSELAIVSCVVSLSLLISAGLDTASESTRIAARRAQMQAEIDHACGINPPPVPPLSH
jgi:hypothetical protein